MTDHVPGTPGDDATASIVVVVDVTDTLRIDYTTGIQRVVREIVGGLRGPEGADLVVVPVVAPSRDAGFRRLTAQEDALLRSHPSGGRAGRRADDFGFLSPLARRVADTPRVLKLRGRLARLRGRGDAHPAHPDLAFRAPRGSVFLDLEGSWYNPTQRSELLPRLGADGVLTMPFVHDVMPVVHPEWFTPHHIAVFRSWLEAHLRRSRAILVNSEHTANDVAGVARSLDVSPDITVVPLGADPLPDTSRGVDLPVAIGRFMLVVGTLEPRKNQALVLDVFDSLRTRHPDLGLVLVGKEGWMVDDLVARIRRHPEHGNRLLWLGGLDDAQLGWLYDHAYLSVAPSRYEGLGVPVQEALAHGCATLSSTGGAQPEAAGGAAELFDPDDAPGLARLVERHLVDEPHHRHWVERAETHPSPTWADTTAVVAAAIRRVTGAAPADN